MFKTVFFEMKTKNDQREIILLDYVTRHVGMRILAS